MAAAADVLWVFPVQTTVEVSQDISVSALHCLLGVRNVDYFFPQEVPMVHHVTVKGLEDQIFQIACQWW